MLNVSPEWMRLSIIIKQCLPEGETEPDTGESDISASACSGHRIWSCPSKNRIFHSSHYEGRPYTDHTFAVCVSLDRTNHNEEQRAEWDKKQSVYIVVKILLKDTNYKRC